MEYNRENEPGGGRSGMSPTGDAGRLNPADGFEGMNYEQRRAQYFPKRQQDGFDAGADAASSADPMLDDRNPI